MATPRVSTQGARKGEVCLTKEDRENLGKEPSLSVQSAHHLGAMPDITELLRHS